VTKKEIAYIKYRVAIVPEQLDRARRRYIHLIREAKRLGLTDILQESERADI